ncbi:MAG: hypothetical protein KJ879_02930 [Nanoarchaeota archaeon]|nr:hypothetical protein [Nanoarchaeota archaeon]
MENERRTLKDYVLPVVAVGAVALGASEAGAAFPGETRTVQDTTYEARSDSTGTIKTMKVWEKEQTFKPGRLWGGNWETTNFTPLYTKADTSYIDTSAAVADTSTGTGGIKYTPAKTDTTKRDSVNVKKTKKTFGSRTATKKAVTLRNIIYSDDSDVSATGEGVLAKRFVAYEVDVDADSVRFDLRAKSGKVVYDVLSGKEAEVATENVLTFLKKGTQTREKKASIIYLEEFLKGTAVGDSTSAENLEDALQVGAFVSGMPVKEGKYFVLAKSEAAKGYSPESVPMVVEIKGKKKSGLKPEDILLREKIRKAGGDFRKPKTSANARPEVAVGYGTNGVSVEGAVRGIVSGGRKGVGLGVYGNVKFKGKETTGASVTTTTDRERQLVGKDTYKERRDTDITTESTKPIGGFGLEVAVRGNGIEFPVRVGAEVMDRALNVQRKSIIVMERNGNSLGTPQLLIGESPVEKNSRELKLAIEASVRKKLSRHTFLKASGQKVFGGDASVRADLGINF